MSHTNELGILVLTYIFASALVQEEEMLFSGKGNVVYSKFPFPEVNDIRIPR